MRVSLRHIFSRASLPLFSKFPFDFTDVFCTCVLTFNDSCKWTSQSRSSILGTYFGIEVAEDAQCEPQILIQSVPNLLVWRVGPNITVNVGESMPALMLERANFTLSTMWRRCGFAGRTLFMYIPLQWISLHHPPGTASNYFTVLFLIIPVPLKLRSHCMFNFPSCNSISCP